MLLAQRVSVALEADLRGRLFARLQSVELSFLDAHDTASLTSIATVDLRQGATVRRQLDDDGDPVGADDRRRRDRHVRLRARAGGDRARAVRAARRPVRAYAGRMRDAYGETRREIAEVGRQVQENIAGAAVIKGFGREPEQLARFRAAAATAARKAIATARLQSLFGSSINALPNVGLIAVLLYGGLVAVAGASATPSSPPSTRTSSCSRLRPSSSAT